MKYDFTSILNRQGMDAIAVEGPGKTVFSPKRGRSITENRTPRRPKKSFWTLFRKVILTVLRFSAATRLSRKIKSHWSGFCEK